MLRQRAPEPPPGLIEQIRKDKVVPFIGAGFSKSAQPKESLPLSGFRGMPTYAELLGRLLDLSKTIKPDDQVVIRNYLQRADSIDPDHNDQAAFIIRKAVGEVPFYLMIREILEPIERGFVGSL